MFIYLKSYTVKVLSLFLILIFPLNGFAQDHQPVKHSGSRIYEILSNTRTNEKKNNPDNLNSYRYYIYNKFYIDEFNYNHSSNIDSLSLPNPEMKELLFMGERVTECNYDKKYGKKNIITANLVSGFKEPFYELINEPIFQEDYPEILKKDFHLYNFQLIDSINLDQGKTYVILFGSKKNLLLNRSRGIVYIDASSFAVVKYSGEEYKEGYTRYFEYTWKPFNNIWYLDKKINKLRFAGLDISKFFSKKYQKKQILFTPWVVIESNTLNFSSPESFSRKEFQGYTYELDKNFNRNLDSKINTFRPVPLNDREKQTYTSTTSLFDMFPIEKNIKKLNSIKKGELPLGKINLDIENFLSFNDYEGFRFQLGGTTNYKFNKNYLLRGYAAMGTKSTNIKGGAGVDFFINRKYDGKLKFDIASDVNPYSKNIRRYAGNINQIKEQLNFIENPVFYSYRKGEVAYEQDFFKRFTTSFSVNYQTQRSEFNYLYKNYNSNHWFNQFITAAHIKYAPFAEYLQTPTGKQTVEDRPVYFYFGYSKGWKGLDTDSDYYKFDLASDISIKNPWGTSNFFINSGYISGQTALWNLYGNFGNAKDANSVFKRFSAKGVHSFETLTAGNFFADKYVALFFNHTFPDLKLWGNKKISVSAVYNGLIGNMEHKNLHAFPNLQIPEKYYQEAGIEFNKLISYLGLGFYYRLGAYNHGNFDDNLFMKLTFTLF